MKPTRSSTAAGSRITVYFPAGISAGFAESIAFLDAISAKWSGSRLVRSGELAFCQPEESAPIMVMETSARVCVCQRLRPHELKTPSTDSELEKMPALVSLYSCARSTIFFTPTARTCGVMAAVCAKYREGSCGASDPLSALPAASRESRMGNKSESGCCTLARLYDDATTRRRLSSSNLLVKARAVRPLKTVRTETTWFS